MLNSGIRWGMLGKNPMAGLQRPREGQPRTRRISEDEIKRLLLALEYSENQPIKLQRQKTGWALLFAIETAMRQGEIAKTLWENVHLEKRYVHLPAAICKTGVARDVPLSPEAIRLIGRLDTDRKGLMLGGITASTVSTMFADAKRMAGIENLKFHDSRREATSRLAKKLHVLDLARVTGHRDIKQLMTYYNKDASELADSL
jgi:integrase